MTPRLATRVWANALVRRVSAAGGFAAVVRHGDDDAGSVLLLLRRRDGTAQVLSRVTGRDGERAWTISLDDAADGAETIDDYLSRQTWRDPDLWAIELDVADPERFIDDPILEG